MKEPSVILVDKDDRQIGVAGKMEAHHKGRLHRAVSVFVINSNGEWILQRRAFDKYHSNGLWTNTCCTHPYPGETAADAALRRLKEEMGIGCTMVELFTFIYKEKLENELTEHELDHVFFGITDDVPVINTAEVEEWEAVSFANLHDDIKKNPSGYTYWFRKIYEKVNDSINQLKEMK
jgi:isopentenyl-diphosphate delta-isomerase